MSLQDTPKSLKALAALELSIAEGTTKVRYNGPGGDKEVNYRSLDEMMTIRTWLRNCLGLNKGQSNRKFGSFNKGFC